MIYVVYPTLQRDLVDKYCFGECGKIIVGAIEIPPIGPGFPCREKDCPHEERISDVMGDYEGEEVCIRKLEE